MRIDEIEFHNRKRPCITHVMVQEMNGFSLFPILKKEDGSHIEANLLTWLGKIDDYQDTLRDRFLVFEMCSLTKLLRTNSPYFKVKRKNFEQVINGDVDHLFDKKPIISISLFGGGDGVDAGKDLANFVVEKVPPIARLMLESQILHPLTCPVFHIAEETDFPTTFILLDPNDFHIWKREIIEIPGEGFMLQTKLDLYRSKTTIVRENW